MGTGLLRVSSASKDVLKFITRETRQLPEHTRRFGPLPEVGAASSSGSSSSASAVGADFSDVARLPNPFIPRYNSKTKRWADSKYSLRRQAVLVKKAKASGLLHLLPPGPKSPILEPSPALNKLNPRFAEAVKQAFEKQAAAIQEKKLRRVPVLPSLRPEESSWTSVTTIVTKKGEVEELAPIQWEGKVELNMKPGADIGIKLYAGKKKMFKGHRFERLKPIIEAKRKVALESMDKRIEGYKNRYRSKRPHPLKTPKSTTKAPKLPF